MGKTIDATISGWIGRQQSMLVTSHVRPDADAVGSLLGLGMALENAGKDVYCVLQDDVGKYAYLPGYQKIQQQADGPVDAIIVLDCSDPKRVGDVLPDSRLPMLVIDHHKTNLNFGEINLVEPDQVATAAILFDHMPEWGLTIRPDVASCLLGGILGDTIGFRTPNVDSGVLRKAASLMDMGADLTKLYRAEIVAKTFTAIHYWGAGLHRLQREGRLIWTFLTLDDRRKIGYSGEDDADLVNVLSSVTDADIALIFIEQAQNHVKVSWRARPGWDVSHIAYAFGGGGHAAAAGADIKGNLDDVMQRVISETRKLLNHETPIGG